jgi:hypothetical protein
VVVFGIIQHSSISFHPSNVLPPPKPVNKALYTNLGYGKGELEGKNVAVLM